MIDSQTAQKKSIFKNPVTYILIVVIAIALIGGYLLLQTFSKVTQTQGSEYREGLEKDMVVVGVLGISGRYPKISYDGESYQINSNAFEGLTILRNGRVIAGLAEKWTNPDERTWRFTLRKTTFHSGEVLKPEDVKFTVETIHKDPSFFGYYSADRIKEVKIVDAQTVDLITSEPDPTLSYWLNYLPILSKSQVTKDGLEKAVGTGPYKIDKLNTKEAVFSANGNYWGGEAKVKKLIYRVFKDFKEIAGKLQKKEVDLAAFTDTKYNKDLKSAGVNISPFRISDVVSLGFDTKNKVSKYVSAATNPFLERGVREAIYLALDPDLILSRADREGEALNQFATPDLIGFNKEIPARKRNIERAKALLERAGFASGFTVTLDIDESAEDLAIEIKKQLAEVGITVQLRSTSLKKFLTRLGLLGGSPPDSSMYLFTYLPDTLDSTDLLNLFVHTPGQNGRGGTNVFSYSNKELDQLLDEASRTFNATDRAKIVAQAHSKVVTELPFIPLYTRVHQFFMQQDVAFKPAPFGYIFGFDISGRQKVNSATE